MIKNKVFVFFITLIILLTLNSHCKHMLAEDKIINQEDILKVCESRENEPTISFEELYHEGLNYNPSKNV